MTQPSPFKWFKTSPEIIRLAVMLYVRFPLSLRNVEDLLHERGVEISHETVGSGGIASDRCSRPRSGSVASKG
jgi:transposase-like protein